MAGRSNRHLRQMRRRMVWFYRAKTEKQAEEKPKPVSYFFEPTIQDFFNGAPEDGTPIYFDKKIIAGLQNIPLAKKDTNESK